MTVRDAARPAAPAPPPPPGPSFLRRHPVLAAFGVLAALSLFAAYWPLSAIATGVVVAGRASGLDRVVYDAARRGVRAVVTRIAHGPRPEPASPAPEPAPAPEPPRASPGTSTPSRSSPQPAPPDPPAPSRPTPPRTRRPRAAGERGPAPRTPSGAGLEL